VRHKGNGKPTGDTNDGTDLLDEHLSLPWSEPTNEGKKMLVVGVRGSPIDIHTDLVNDVDEHAFEG
jgi:hypothetical protein